MQVHVIPVTWETHRDILQEIRSKVFIDEQGVAREIEWDGQDDAAHHFLAINEAGQSLGCARLLPSGQIGRMAVLPHYRNSGIGFRLLQLAVEEAARVGFATLFLNAQTHAEPFYRKAGFVPVGGEFLEAGIPHQRMELVLPVAFEATQGLEAPILRQASADPGDSPGSLAQHAGEAECVAGLVAAVADPHRVVRIYSQHLDHVLFDEPTVVAALSAYLRHGPPTNLLILLHSSKLIVGRGHRLLELARRLDSKVRIRVVPADFAEDQHSYVLCDDTGYWMMPDFREYAAHSNAHDPVRARQLRERFVYLWEHSREDPDLRSLRL